MSLSIGRLSPLSYEWRACHGLTEVFVEIEPWRLAPRFQAFKWLPALEWRKAIDAGHYPPQADIASGNGISRARVTQILNFLRLSPMVTEIIGDLGDPLPSPIVTERQLRGIVNLPRRKQRKEVAVVPGGIRSDRGLTRHS